MDGMQFEGMVRCIRQQQTERETVMGLKHLGSGATRRQFLKTSATAAALALAVPSIATVLTKNAMAATTVENIKKAGVVRVGCEAAYRPFAFREGNKIVGYDIDLASLLFAPLGVKVEMVDTAWAGVIPALYAGNFDLIMTSLTYTKETKKEATRSRTESYFPMEPSSTSNQSANLYSPQPGNLSRWSLHRSM
jgi:hypothetical protein